MSEEMEIEVESGKRATRFAGFINSSGEINKAAATQ